MTPTLSLVSKVVSLRLGRSETELRIGGSADAKAARMAFAWVADQVCEAGRVAIALWVGHGFGNIAALIAEAEAQRRDVAFAALLDEIALECMAETLVRDKLGLLRPERDPRDIAIALIQRHGVVSSVEMRALAAAFLAYDDPSSHIEAPKPPPAVAPSLPKPLLDAVRAVAEAYRRLDRSVWTPGERAAREALDKTLQTLSEHPALGHPAPEPRKLSATPKLEKSHG